MLDRRANALHADLLPRSQLSPPTFACSNEPAGIHYECEKLSNRYQQQIELIDKYMCTKCRKLQEQLEAKKKLEEQLLKDKAEQELQKAAAVKN